MKKKIKLILTFIGLMTGIVSSQAMEDKESVSTSKSAFIAKQDQKIIKHIGNIDVRQYPYSTFKVALALMAYDSHFFQDKENPSFAFKEEYEKNFQSWYTHEIGIDLNWCQDQTPFTFMKYSAVWVSHLITKFLGKEKFQEYVTLLNYGNKDVSGTPGKDDGLINSWLGTSLEISPREQVEFLEKLLSDELTISKSAQEKTKQIMDREEEWNGWKLFGKTGGGKYKGGWFIGWVEKGDQKIVFAQFLDLDDADLDLTGITPQKTVGLTAKEVIKKQLLATLSA